jgi:hypothetical protein
MDLALRKKRIIAKEILENSWKTLLMDKHILKDNHILKLNILGCDSAPMDFLTALTFYNPWEEMGGPSIMFGAPQVDDDDIEEDLGGREESDEEEEEDIPAADTPTDEEEEDNDDDDE